MSAALVLDDRRRLYYECENCGNFQPIPEKYDKFHGENKDDIILLEFAKYINSFTNSAVLENINERRVGEAISPISVRKSPK